MKTNKSYYTGEMEITAMQDELAHAHEMLLQEDNVYKRRKLLHVVSTTLSFLVIGFLVYVFLMVSTARANGEVPTLFGYQIYEIQSGSMDPTLPVQSLILSQQVDENDTLKVGDVITFIHNDVTITHRIIDVRTDEQGVKYQTKGDNAANSIDPELIPHSEVQAKFLVKLPFYLSTSDTTGGDGK